jgi:hypothetical protein
MKDFRSGERASDKLEGKLSQTRCQSLLLIKAQTCVGKLNLIRPSMYITRLTVVCSPPPPVRNLRAFPPTTVTAWSQKKKKTVSHDPMHRRPPSRSTRRRPCTHATQHSRRNRRVAAIRLDTLPHGVIPSHGAATSSPRSIPRA